LSLILIGTGLSHWHASRSPPSYDRRIPSGLFRLGERGRYTARRMFGPAALDKLRPQQASKSHRGLSCYPCRDETDFKKNKLNRRNKRDIWKISTRESYSDSRCSHAFLGSHKQKYVITRHDYDNVYIQQLESKQAKRYPSCLQSNKPPTPSSDQSHHPTTHTAAQFMQTTR
jgi:hypothetical protein